MEWALFQLVKLVLLTGLAIGLQRAFRRAGDPVVSEVFAARPRVGKGLIALSDIGFYCLYGAYILFNVQVMDGSGAPSAGDVQNAVYSIGAFFLTIGFLHGCNVFFLTVVAGRVVKRMERAAAYQAWMGANPPAAPAPAGSGTPQSPR